MTVYALPRATPPEETYPLVHIGDTLWFPFSFYYCVPVTVRDVNFYLSHPTGVSREFHASIGFGTWPLDAYGVMYPEAQDDDGNFRGLGHEGFELEGKLYRLEEFTVCSQFIWIDEPVGHGVELWTPACPWNPSFDDVFLTLQDAQAGLMPRKFKHRRAHSALMRWRRSHIDGLNRNHRRCGMAGDLTTAAYCDKPVYSTRS